MYILEKQLKSFAAAHRLTKDHKGDCNSLHGHNYTVTVKLASDQLDHQDFVMDFNDIKHLCSVWIRENLDHSVLVCSLDKKLLAFVEDDKQKHYVMPNDMNTSAEAIAQHLYDQFKTIIEQNKRNQHIILKAVRISETATSSVIYCE